MSVQEYRQLREALETWRRHRRNGTMPPMKTMEVIVGAARRDLARWQECGECEGTGCIHIEDKMEYRIIAGLEDPCCPSCGGSGVLPNQARQSDALRGDGPCSDCGTTENPTWFTDSVFWNAVIRQGDYVEPILCLNCFVVRVDQAGFSCRWRLLPEFHWETKAEAVLRAVKEDTQ